MLTDTLRTLTGIKNLTLKKNTKILNQEKQKLELKTVPHRANAVPMKQILPHRLPEPIVQIQDITTKSLRRCWSQAEKI